MQSFDEPIIDEPEENFNEEIVRRRLHRRNPRVPMKKLHGEMSVRKAKRLLYNQRTPGRPSRELSSRLKEAKKVLRAANLPLRRPDKLKKLTKKPGKLGRPKKPHIEKTKRPRGRPKKNPTVIKAKRPRGRPRKHPIQEKTKRPRGRPRKNPLQQMVDRVKRPRGRPRKSTPPQ